MQNKLIVEVIQLERKSKKYRNKTKLGIKHLKMVQVRERTIIIIKIHKIKELLKNPKKKFIKIKLI